MLALAKRGDSSGQICVGVFFADGKGTRRSRERALYWSRRAVLQGVACAASNIGTIYRDERRPRLAMRWFLNSVRMGNKEAWLEIAKLHLGPLRNRTLARRALMRVLRAAEVTEGGHEEAARLLAGL